MKKEKSENKTAKNPVKSPAKNSAKSDAIKKAVLNQLKSLIFPLILFAIIVVAIVYVINVKDKEEEEPIIRVNAYDGPTDPIVMENNDLRFEMDPTTTQFSVTVKSTGKTWFSNPVDVSSDGLANVTEKAKLNSTLLMEFAVTAGAVTSYSNYDHGIENGVYEIEATKDCIKVCYSIGNVEKEYVIPPITTERQMDEWLSKMSKDESNLVKQYYKKYDIKKPGKKDDVEQLKTDYPVYENEPIYVLRDTVTENLKIKMEEFFEAVGYTLEDWQADKELNFAEAISDKPVFNVNMYYRLDGKNLVLEIPYKELEYKASTPLYTLTPLPYFGAGGLGDEGYLMVPEGGGALIRFNNGKTAQNNYFSNMYGWDKALGRDAVVNDTKCYFNAFGISQGDDSFLCILEDGSSYASVQADISGRYNSYNFANAIYSVTLREQYKVAALVSSSIYVYLPSLPDESLVQRYHFIDSGDYIDMAKEYQSYLKNTYSAQMTRLQDTQAPVVVEIVSAVDKVKQVLGIPTSLPLKLTTFKEAKDMVSELHSEGMQNLSVKLTGWANGGVNQKILKKVKLVSDCGSKKDLKNLAETSKSLGVDFYLDGVTQYAYDSDLLDGFNSFSDAARFISKERAEIYQYSTVTYGKREGADTYYLLHSDLMNRMVDNLTNAAKQYGANVAFREIGSELSGDYYQKKTTSREAARKQQMQQLADISAGGSKIMINAGNNYAIPYSSMITNMDLQGKEYTLIDEFVPFYQLAIHGYKNYVGKPLNLSADPAEELLRSAEYGAGLSFTIMKSSPFVLQKTLYTEYFGSSYDAWHGRMVDTYNRYNRELGHIFNQEMVSHETFEEGLTCTTYADGTKVYVNYNYLDKTADGKKIPARDYMVVR